MFVPTFLLPVPAAVHDEGRPASFQLDYSAPAGCPSRERFLAAIRQRTPSATARTPENGALSEEDESMHVLAAIEEHQGITSGKLTLRVRKVSVTREVPPAPCAEVAETMAIIVAMALAREARESGADAAAGPSPPADAQPPSAGAAETQPGPKARAAEEAAPRAARPNIASESETLETAPSHGEPGARAFRLGFAVAGGAEAGPASGLLPSASAGLDGWWRRSGWLSPSVRVRLVFGERSVTTAVGSAEFRLLTARINLCPLRSPRGWLSVVFCSSLDVGQLRAQGDIPGGRTETMLWLGAGANARAEYAVGSVLALELGVDFNILASRQRFSFQPGDQLVHQVPAAAVGGFFGVLVHLP